MTADEARDQIALTDEERLTIEDATPPTDYWNEMRHLYATVERIIAARVDQSQDRARLAATVTEYAVRYPGGYVLEFPHPTLALPAAENRIRHEGEGEVVTRERTTYRDDVTDWEGEG